MVIHLISGPCNVSTALMYSFAQRRDTKVIDEPFYGFYLQATGIEHPGREQILATMELDPKKIFDQLTLAERERGTVFVKNMGHHLQGFDYEPIKQFANI